MINVRNYGMPERIWLLFWSSLGFLWLISYGQVAHFWESAFVNFSILVALLTTPFYIHRFGHISLNVSRAFFSFISSFFAYERIEDFINAYRPDTSYELTMLGIDKALIGGNPSEWFQAFYSPVLSEYFQIVYWLYFPQILFIGFVMIYLKKHELFLQYLLTMTLALMFTHIFYFIVPLRSPFYIADLGLFTEYLHYEKSLEGLWFFDKLRTSLLEATTMRYDCFPSGHTMHSLIALIFAWKTNKKLGLLETVIASSIVISTLYLRYHYAIDLIVGGASAILWYYLGSKLIKYAIPMEPIDSSVPRQR